MPACVHVFAYFCTHASVARCLCWHACGVCAHAGLHACIVRGCVSCMVRARYISRVGPHAGRAMARLKFPANILSHKC